MRVLVSSVPGLGHLHPVLPLALAAAAAGHDVRVATGADRLDWVVRCGATAVAAGLPHDELVQAALALAGPERPRHLFTTLAVPPMARDLLEVVDRWAPDLLLHEEGEYAAPLVAALTGLPCVTHSWSSPARPAAGRRVLDGPLRAVWDDAGASGDVTQVGGTYLDACPPLLQGDGIAAVPVPVLRVRPSSFDGPPAPAPQWLASLPRPAVYVTLGTEAAFSSPPLLQRLVDAAAGSAAVVVSTGPHPADAVRRPHDGVHAVQYLPQSLVLPAVDAVVCHGGAGTTTGALLHGLPVLALPGLAPSQQAVAGRLAATGVGLHLAWDDAAPEVLAAAVRRLLEADDVRARVREDRDALAALPGPDELVAVLEAAAAGAPTAAGPGAAVRP